MVFFRNEKSGNPFNKIQTIPAGKKEKSVEPAPEGAGQFRDENANKYNVQTLSDIARGMQYCVNSASEIVEKHYIDMFSRYFDDEGNPYVQTFNMSNGYKIEVPVFLMMGYNSMNMEEMTVKLLISLKEMKQKTHMFSGDEDEEDGGEEARNLATSRTSFTVALASENEDGTPGSQNVTIEMKFKAGDPPEAVSRVVETFANTVIPEKAGTDEEEMN